MNKTEALRQALEALEGVLDDSPKVLDASISGGLYEVVQCREAITAIKEALAQPKQEPLEYWNAVEGWVKIDEVRQHFETVSCGTIYKNAGEGRVPVYTAPQKREWVGLTVEQIEDVGFNLLPTVAQKDFVAFARYVEMLSKEKNHD
jgi:hypothetical protein